MLIGVLALQGDFREHITALDACGANSIEVRTVEHLNSCDGLIIPGGESTVIQKIAESVGLVVPIKNKITEGFPTFGTCAGLIMLADEILDGLPGQVGFGGIDISIRRNAFGNQLESFESDLEFVGIPGGIHAAFIRAPVIERVGEGVEVLSRLPGGKIVAVKAGSIMGTAFHPELTGELRVHKQFIEIISSSMS